jgi:hypothetical protein
MVPQAFFISWTYGIKRIINRQTLVTFMEAKQMGS